MSLFEQMQKASAHLKTLDRGDHLETKEMKLLLEFLQGMIALADDHGFKMLRWYFIHRMHSVEGYLQARREMR